MSVRIKGTSNEAEVNSAGQLHIMPEVDSTTNPDNVGAVKIMSEVDNGSISGTTYLKSPEADNNYRLRVSEDTLLDAETFNYTAQNTGKHIYRNTTMTVTFTAAGISTNGSSITTTSTGVSFQTYKYFPLMGSMSTYVEFEGSLTAQPTTNCTIDIGLFLNATSTPYAPTDGVYFRINSAGFQGIINNNASETTTSVFSSFTATLNKKYQFIISITQRKVDFWINNLLYGTIVTPSGMGQPFMSASLPFGIRQGHVGAAGAAVSFVMNNYTVTLGGGIFADTLGAIGNRVYGCYEGLSGGTMGSLANFANSTNPTAAVPTNTTAALGTGLGGQFWETATLAITPVDGIICSYLNPAGTVAISGKRLRINGIGLVSFIQTAITGGPFNAVYSLAFGHNALSLATSEAATTKAPRRIALPFTQLITSAQAINTMVTQSVYWINFQNPIYINPGEYIALVTKHIGTVGTAGTIAHNVTFDAGWE